jgi:hypothetical protein
MRGEEERRRLSGDARDGEHDTGHHPLDRRAGEPRVCAMTVPPSPSEQDCRRISRESAFETFGRSIEELIGMIARKGGERSIAAVGGQPSPVGSLPWTPRNRTMATAGARNPGTVARDRVGDAAGEALSGSYIFLGQTYSAEAARR